MINKPVIRVLIIISCFFLISLSLKANEKQKWNEQMMTIYRNDLLSDSLKIVQIADLTFDYCVYYRVMDEDVLNQYLNLMLPLISEHNNNDLKVYLYRPLFFVSAEPEDEQALMEQYAGFIKNSTNPLIRYDGWMIMARTNMDKAIALNYLFNALNEVKDNKYRREQAEANQYISYYYSIQANYANQLKYALRSVELAKESGNIRQQVASWKELGAAYYEDPANNSIDQSLEAYTNARNLFNEKIKIGKTDFKDDLLYMEVLVTLGSIYQSKNQLSQALNAFEETLQIALTYGVIETQAFCNKELGTIYQTLRNYQKAESHYLKTEQLIEESDIKTIESLHIEYEIQLQLAGLYRETGHYKESVTYYKEGIHNYRRMFDEEIMNENQRLSAYYEARKQEEDIAGLKTIVELKERQKYYYYGIAFILLLILLAIIRLYHYKIKATKQLEKQLKGEVALLELDRSKAELQANLKQKESELLQEKLTVGDELLEHKNRVLENLKKFISTHSELNEYKGQIENILLQQNRIESNVDSIKTGLQDVPIDFYVRLQRQADNKLTPLDLKYCRLIYLQTPSKEMAEQLFVDQKTIRVNKYRLKQKLKLGKEEDLQIFINNIIPAREPKNE